MSFGSHSSFFNLNSHNGLKKRLLFHSLSTQAPDTCLSVVTRRRHLIFSMKGVPPSPSGSGSCLPWKCRIWTNITYQHGRVLMCWFCFLIAPVRLFNGQWHPHLCTFPFIYRIFDSCSAHLTCLCCLCGLNWEGLAPEAVKLHFNIPWITK